MDKDEKKKRMVEFFYAQLQWEFCRVHCPRPLKRSCGESRRQECYAEFRKMAEEEYEYNVREE